MYYVNKTLRKKNVQDRMERCRLETELKLLDRQKRIELKMHESEAKKIRSGYSKAGVYLDSFSEATGVRMYETHNPGFCYTRNGTHKIPPCILSTPVLDFKQLKSLIFTEDELDIEKLLCLHLLSVHQTDTLVMPSLKDLKDIPEANTPMERLIQRSKKFSRVNKEDQEILNFLPIYIIDVGEDASCTTLSFATKEEENEELLFRDARITSRLIVNTKIQKILISALTALRNSKSDKWKRIGECCHNVTYLKKIFNKQPIQEFLRMLKTFSLLTSCESYHLTPKIKQHLSHIEIRTRFGNLESLIHQIRKYILQMPSKKRNEWKSLNELNDEYRGDNLVASTTSHHLESGKFTARQKKSSSSTITRKNSEIASKFSSRSYRSFVGNNKLMVKGENLSKKMLEVEIRSNNSLAVFSMPSSNLPVVSRHEPETKSVGECDVIREKNSEEEKLKNIIPNSFSFIKRTSCCACQQKWKCCLPSPKIPNYTRPGLPLQVYEDPFKIRNMNRISSMISEELYRLNSYDTKYSANNVRIKVPKNLTVSIAPEKKDSAVIESLEINPYDLARISHEIADKETDEKLNAFLREII